MRKRLQTHPSRITGLLPSGRINIDRTNRIQLLPQADTNVDMTAPGSDAEDQRRKAAAARYRRSLQLLAKGTAHHAAGPAQALKAKLAQQRNIARMSDDIPTEGNVLSARFDRASDSPERLPSKPQSPLDGLEALGVTFLTDSDMKKMAAKVKQTSSIGNKHNTMHNTNAFYPSSTQASSEEEDKPARKPSYKEVTFQLPHPQTPLNPVTANTSSPKQAVLGLKENMTTLQKKVTLMQQEFNTVRKPHTLHSKHIPPTKYPHTPQAMADVSKLTHTVLDNSVKSASQTKILKEQVNSLHDEVRTLAEKYSKSGAKAAADTMAACNQQISSMKDKLASSEKANESLRADLAKMLHIAEVSSAGLEKGRMLQDAERRLAQLEKMNAEHLQAQQDILQQLREVTTRIDTRSVPNGAPGPAVPYPEGTATSPGGHRLSWADMADEDSPMSMSQKVVAHDTSADGSTDQLQLGLERSLLEAAQQEPQEFPPRTYGQLPLYKAFLDEATQQYRSARECFLYLEEQLLLPSLLPAGKRQDLKKRFDKVSECLDTLQIRLKRAGTNYDICLRQTQAEALEHECHTLNALNQQAAQQSDLATHLTETRSNVREAERLANAAKAAVTAEQANINAEKQLLLKEERFQQQQRDIAEQANKEAQARINQRAAEAAEEDLRRKRQKTDKLAAIKAQLEARLAEVSAAMTSNDDMDIDDPAERPDDTYAGVAKKQITNHQASLPTKELVKVPLPQTYSGDPHDDVDEVIFTFENYLVGNSVPRARWPVHAMQLLKGKALQAYISFAQPLHKQGIVPTWEQFTEVIRGAFITHDRQLEARTHLLSVTQTGSVTAYLQNFRILITRAGSPAPTDKDLLLLYWKGLKQWVRDESKIDPTTGEFWTSFEDLARHTITIARQKDLSSPMPDKRRPPYRRPRPNPLKLNNTKLKHSSSSQKDRTGTGRGLGGGFRGGRGGGPQKFRKNDRPHSNGSGTSNDSNKENKPRVCKGTCSDNQPCNGPERHYGKDDYEHRNPSCSYFNGKPSNKGNTRT